MQHNMKVSNPCQSCVHNKVCMNKAIMEQVQCRVNDQFFGNFGDTAGKYHLIDEMSKAKITAKLSCDNYVSEGDIL